MIAARSQSSNNRGSGRWPMSVIVRLAIGCGSEGQLSGTALVEVAGSVVSEAWDVSGPAAIWLGSPSATWFVSPGW